MQNPLVVVVLFAISIAMSGCGGSTAGSKKSTSSYVTQQQVDDIMSRVTFSADVQRKSIRDPNEIRRLLTQTDGNPYTFYMTRQAVPLFIRDYEWSIQFTNTPYTKDFEFKNVCSAMVFRSHFQLSKNAPNNGWWCVLNNGMVVWQADEIISVGGIPSGAVGSEYTGLAYNFEYMLVKNNPNSSSLDDVAFHALDQNVEVIGKDAFEVYRANLPKRTRRSYGIVDLLNDFEDLAGGVARAADEIVTAGVRELENYLYDNPDALRNALIGGAAAVAYRQVTKPDISSQEAQRIERFQDNKAEVVSSIQQIRSQLVSFESRQTTATETYRKVQSDLSNAPRSCQRQISREAGAVADQSVNVTAIYRRNIEKADRMIAALQEPQIGATFSALGGALSGGSGSTDLASSVKSNIDESNANLRRLRNLEADYNALHTLPQSAEFQSAANEYDTRYKQLSATYNSCN